MRGCRDITGALKNVMNMIRADKTNSIVVEIMTMTGIPIMIKTVHILKEQSMMPRELTRKEGDGDEYCR